MMDNKEFSTAIRHVLQSEKLLAEFRLEYAVVSGARFEAAYEYEQRLAVSGGGQAALSRRRSPADSDVAPPGNYQGTLPKEEIPALLAKLETADMQAIPQEVPSPQDPVFTLSIVAARKLFAFRWGPVEPIVPPDIEFVLDTLARWAQTACPRPVWSLTLKATAVRFTGEGIEASMRLENAGPERVYVVHPASPFHPDRKSLLVRHGVYPKEIPGFTPLPMDVEESILEVPLLTATELVPVSAESPLEFTLRAPVAFSGGGGRVGIFSYRCYALPSGVAGLNVFAGAVFSQESPL
jgi:hypothetical protein